MNRIEYSLSNKDYDGLLVELQNYQTIQQEGMKVVNEEYLANMIQPTIMNAKDYTVPPSITHPQNWDDVLRNIGKGAPEVQKQLIGGGMNIAGLVAQDANQFWKVATGDVNGYQEYVEQNGSFVESISQLPFDIKDTVRINVRKQLYVNDAKGFILRPDSDLSLAIAQSPTFHSFIKEHLNELLRGDIVSGSVAFKNLWQEPNLALTLGYANIINTYINKNGDIVSFILDTYDFNPNEQWYIEWARNVQEKGLLSGFYSLIIVVVPKQVWIKWR